MDPPSPFEAKKSLNRQHSPSSWLGTNLYDDSSSPRCSTNALLLLSSSSLSSRRPITSSSDTATAALMTQQAVIDLVNSQRQDHSHHETLAAAAASGAVLPGSAAVGPTTTPPRRSSALLMGGWAGIRQGLPLSSLLSDDHHPMSTSLSSSRIGGIVDEERVMAVLALTTREVRSIALADDDVDGRPSSPFGNDGGTAFRRLQQHVRNQGFVTDTAIKHRLPELLRSHRLEKVEAERRRQQQLPELAAYELEFASTSSSTATPPPSSAFRGADRCHHDGGGAFSSDDEAPRTARRTGTSSPRSIVQVVDFPDSDDGDAAFLDSRTAFAKGGDDRPERQAKSSPLCRVRFQS